MELRPYQAQAKQSVLDAWGQGICRTLVVLPTGCGKTIVFSKLTEQCVAEGKRVLILAHRGELLTQAAEKLLSATGLKCATEKAQETCLGSWFRVVVGSVQSLGRASRLKRFSPDYFDTIIIDEAHHALSKGYLAILNHFTTAQVLGVTATPDRGDMQDLGAVFQSVAFSYSLPQAIKDGYLVPIKALTIPLKLDLSAVGIQGGDFKLGDVDSALDPYLYQIGEEMVKVCRERKTVVFLPLVATSQKFCAILNQLGLTAVEINGNSPDRQQILQDFDGGKYQVLCNSMLLTEGWDCPSVDCVVVLRPTKVRSLYSQMVGRGTRLCQGKDHLLLLDFLWHTERHELCHPASLIAPSQELAKAMTEVIEQAGTAMDLEVAEVQGQSEVVAQREDALAKQLKAKESRKRGLVDPLQFATKMLDMDLSNFVPDFGWQGGAPTSQQIKELEWHGVSAEGLTSSKEAAQMLDKLQERKQAGLTTPKQIRQLSQRGFQQVEQWSSEAASNLITRISANGWRTPSAIDPQTYRPEV